jgi:hypothetical protein
MKMINNILATLIGLSVSNGSADIATIDVNNYGPEASPIYWYEQELLKATGSYVQLYAWTPQGPPLGSAWLAVSPWIPLSEDGFFAGGVYEVVGFSPPTTAEFMLRAWTTAHTGLEDNGEVKWSQQTGQWNPLAEPATPQTGPGLKNPPLYIVPSEDPPFIPEPSTLVLSLIGGIIITSLSRRSAPPGFGSALGTDRVDPSPSRKIRRKIGG